MLCEFTAAGVLVPDRGRLRDGGSRLAASDQRLASVIHQFYYLGYSTSEMAQFADVSEKTVDRDLKKARTLLRKMLEETAPNR